MCRANGGGSLQGKDFAVCCTSSFFLAESHLKQILFAFISSEKKFLSQQNKPSQKHSVSHLQNKLFQVLLGPHGKSTPPFYWMVFSPKHPIFLKWLFLNDPQLKALPFTLGSLCRLYGVEQDLSFVLGNSINPASI